MKLSICKNRKMETFFVKKSLFLFFHQNYYFLANTFFHTTAKKSIRIYIKARKTFIILTLFWGFLRKMENDILANIFVVPNILDRKERFGSFCLHGFLLHFYQNDCSIRINFRGDCLYYCFRNITLYYEKSG